MDHLPATSNENNCGRKVSYLRLATSKVFLCVWTATLRLIRSSTVSKWTVWRKPLPRNDQYWSTGCELGFHQSNVGPFFFLVTHQKLRELSWEVLMHPAHSPKLALCDYHLFMPVAYDLAGEELANDLPFTSTSELTTNKVMLSIWIRLERDCPSSSASAFPNGHCSSKERSQWINYENEWSHAGIRIGYFIKISFYHRQFFF